ncbi:Tuberous sclerosis 2-like protein, partial [Coemansia nantahalensis]
MGLGGRPADSGRGADQPSGRGASSIVTLFRSVLRGSFGHERRGTGPPAAPLAQDPARPPAVAAAAAAATDSHQCDAIAGDRCSMAPDAPAEADPPVDCAQLALEHGALADASAPLVDRLAALHALIPELQSRPLANVGGLWGMLSGIVDVAFGDADGSSAASVGASDIGQRGDARMLILALLATLSDCAEDEAAFGAGARETRTSMQRALAAVETWEEVEVAIRCASWATHRAQCLVGAPDEWFARAHRWIDLAAARCYPRDCTRSPFEDADPDAGIALTEALDFLTCIVAADYPALKPEAVHSATGHFCAQAAQTRVCNEHGIDEVAWVWTEPDHTYGVLCLLNAVITYGALSFDALHSAVMLLCVTVNITKCQELCGDIVYTLFTSCYMRSTLLAMNDILRGGNADLNALHIYGLPSLTPYQTAVYGIVYYITRVMDAGPTGFQFSLRTGNCLPVLSEAARRMYPEVLRLVFPYLCKVANDDRVDSMMADDWAVLIGILENTVDCRLSSQHYDGIDDGAGDAPLKDLYDGALHAIVSVFCRCGMAIPTALVDLLYRMREVLSDDLAQSMLVFAEAREMLRPGSSSWMDMLEEVMHLYYFDRGRSITLRRLTARLCAKAFLEAYDADVEHIERMSFIVAMFDQLSLEEDEKVVGSLMEMLSVSLRRPKETRCFHALLGHTMRAAVEPAFVRCQQGDELHMEQMRQQERQHQQERRQERQEERPDARQVGGSWQAPGGDKDARPHHLGNDCIYEKDERSYASWARISQSADCLLDVLVWRVNMADTIGARYGAESEANTIALVNRLLDLLSSPHTFPSVQRRILAVFMRVHADADLRLYVRQPGCDAVMDQRVSLHENARLRLAVDAAEESGSRGGDGSDSGSHDGDQDETQFPIRRYILTVLFVFETNVDLETFTMLCQGLTVQLSNRYLFSVCNTTMAKFTGSIVDHMMTRYDQAARANLAPDERNRISNFTYGLLASTMHHKHVMARSVQDKLLALFNDGIAVPKGASATPQICLHALNVAMLELPLAMMRKLPDIFKQLVKIFSAAQLSVHLLEFVSSLARDPRLCANLRAEDYRPIFAIAINYIRSRNSQRRRDMSLQAGAAGGDKSASRRQSTIEDPRPAPDKASIQEVALDQYVLVMAYQVIDIFYMSLSPPFRAQLVDHLIVGLLQANYHQDQLDEVNEVCLDMILQHHGRSSEEIMRVEEVSTKEDIGPVVERSWIQHNAIVTIRAQTMGRLAQIVVRTPSGTTSRTIDLPAEIVRKSEERAEQAPMTSLPTSPLSGASTPTSSLSRATSHGRAVVGRTRRMHSIVNASGAGGGGSGAPHAMLDVLPADSVRRLLRGELLPEAGTLRSPPLPIRYGPAACLAQEFITGYQGLMNLDPPAMLPPGLEAVARSLRLFDNNPTVDTHKVSVVYVGPGQNTEREILLNQQGSPAYWSFLRGLGHIRRLCRMEGFSAGLDTSGHDRDGRYTVRWRDLISRLVFHVGTLMPADEHRQEQLVRKKAHMGNDFVHIVFNESGREYGLDTIPSQFNFVQIIVTPVDGQYNSHKGGEGRAHD